jgi:hypothetical protein
MHARSWREQGDHEDTKSVSRELSEACALLSLILRTGLLTDAQIRQAVCDFLAREDGGPSLSLSVTRFDWDDDDVVAHVDTLAATEMGTDKRHDKQQVNNREDEDDRHSQ